MVRNIAVQAHDFVLSDEYDTLSSRTNIGAVVSFVGKVRDMNLNDNVIGLSLEHYPGMTEKSLHAIVDQAEQRWPLLGVTLIHRVGDLDLGDQIVLVAVASAHRQAAFSACDFIMDYLKTQAPFWKKERTKSDTRWLDARESDVLAAQRWQTE
ncbi:molybdopterin synthase catalytic subunit MoaE [Vibrio zhugei]|uniref:Molybdopterin synthase catalytic subunit n=1 Tax=Vibrio zhugei TaxID=2479546 RepID=A0ABV7C5S3_9VIBR|nr:molybdopterin synthase catalytic subunit MoaE [Vibrio zhugei]